MIAASLYFTSVLATLLRRFSKINPLIAIAPLGIPWPHRGHQPRNGALNYAQLELFWDPGPISTILSTTGSGASFFVRDTNRIVSTTSAVIHPIEIGHINMGLDRRKFR